MIFEEKTIDSSLVFDGPVFKVRTHTVCSKDGAPVRRDIVEHNGAAAICAVTPEQKLVMIRQYRKAAEAVVWEIPAGKIDPGETSLQTARRELREETGYLAEGFRLLSRFYGTIGYNNEVIELYLARTTERGPTDFDEHEAIEVCEMDIDVLLAMIEQGEIIDAKTIIGILIVARLQEGRWG